MIGYLTVQCMMMMFVNDTNVEPEHEKNESTSAGIEEEK